VSHRHRYQLVGDLNALEPGGPDDQLLLHQQPCAAGATPKSTRKVAVAPFFPARGFSTGAAAIPRPDGTPTAWRPSSTPGMWRLPTFKSIECVCLLFCTISPLQNLVALPACLTCLGPSSLVGSSTLLPACAACAPLRYWLHPFGNLALPCLSAKSGEAILQKTCLREDMER
jgi:hypothetical protein